MRDFSKLHAFLDDVGETGQALRFWLRDDDAVTVTPALERLLSILSRSDIPALIAAVPARADAALPARLRDQERIRVAVHGLAHVSHSKGRQRKSELGSARPTDVVVADLIAARERSEELFGPKHIPILVPPWNRITPKVVDRLPEAGFLALSVFKREKTAPLPLVNTHLDLINWRGDRMGRSDGLLIGLLRRLVGRGVTDIGILSHHLDHDERAWSFLERFVEVATDHPAASIVSAEALVAERSGGSPQFSRPGFPPNEGRDGSPDHLLASAGNRANYHTK